MMFKAPPDSTGGDGSDATLPPSRIEEYPSLVKPLLFVFAAAMLAFAFAMLGSEVGEGDTLVFDMQVIQRAQALRTGHPWLAEVMRDLSGVGSTVVLTLFTIATVGYLALVSQRLIAIFVATSVISGTVLVGMFKGIVGRIRPDAAYAELAASGLSFPSGHASMSAIVFLTIGALLANFHKRVSERVYIFVAAALLTLLVGLSRIALGVHYATDVLGGWAFGSAWAIVWLLLAWFVASKDGGAN
jgi:undecaprenyl-diphosphatase